MKKIASLFMRNYETDRLVRNEVVPGSEWVINGEGHAYRKWDGTCCMVRDGKLYKRYDAKKGKTPPEGFEPAQDYDPITGHMPGWIAVGDGPDDRWHREGFELTKLHDMPNGIPDGTYELVGPKIQSNAESFPDHRLIQHGYERLPHFPRTYDEIKTAFETMDAEGVVWHHPDGRMVKIKKRDFGMSRAIKPT